MRAAPRGVVQATSHLNVQAAITTLVGSSEVQKYVTFQPLFFVEWLSERLYKTGDRGNMLLLKSGIDTRVLCVPQTMNFSSMRGLCNLPMLRSFSTSMYRMDFSCPKEGVDLMQCRYTCPVLQPRCGPSYKAVYTSKLCREEGEGINAKRPYFLVQQIFGLFVCSKDASSQTGWNKRTSRGKRRYEYTNHCNYGFMVGGHGHHYYCHCRSRRTSQVDIDKRYLRFHLVMT